MLVEISLHRCKADVFIPFLREGGIPQHTNDSRALGSTKDAT